MNIQETDQQFIWHPFTQHQTAQPNIPIVRGRGAFLYDSEGKEYLDLISSWWVNIHGHAHPHIAQAIFEQARRLEHVIFAKFTHEPAARLSEKLISLLPQPFQRVFFSDNGSTAVEVALKMAYQYWYNLGQRERTVFVAFEGAYHGDTFGAMAVGKSSGFYSPFESLLFEVMTLPYPDTWEGDTEVEEKEEQALLALEQLLTHHGETVAAFICEPLLQGSSGMRCCRPEFLRTVIDKFRAHGALVIFDEVFTGFGRTGTLFAMEQVDRVPDMVCLSKGLTGGFLPLAVTVCQEAIYEAFLGDVFEKAFIHGHSYTANPLGCAAACASLELFEKENTLEKIQRIQEIHRREMSLLKVKHPIMAPRVCGTMAAFNLHSPKTVYTNPAGRELELACREHGLLLRPLGNCIYLLPPYCIEEDTLQNAYTQLSSMLPTALFQ